MNTRRNKTHSATYKCILLLVVVCFLFFPQPVKAATPTPKASPTNKPVPTIAIDKQINDLKERIASRVAQLKLVEKRGVLGTVTDVSGTQITLDDAQGDTRFIDVDEITKFSSPSAKDFGLSDLTKGAKISVLGLYNKQSRRIMARFVDVVVTPSQVAGVVAAIDAEEFTVLVQTETNERVTVDVENVTKTNIYTKEKGVAKSGFSKITVGTRVIVTGFPNVKDRKRIIASRILLFPDVLPNPKINLTVQEAIDAHAPTVSSTGSGKKLTPITR